LSNRLLWKLLFENILVILFVILVVWMAIDYLAADYFVQLMEKYKISPEPAHEMFVSSVHRYLIWASLAAMLLALILGFAMMKRILDPLTRMTDTTREIAAGNYAVKIPVKSTDEVGQLAAAFNRMSQSLQEIEKLRKTMLIDVTHELRTPLTNIQGYLEGLVDGVVTPTRENFELLHSETMRLVKLVEDILQLASADAAKGNLRPRQFGIFELVTSIYESFRKDFENKQITVQIAGPDSENTLWADPDKIEQVIRNLMQNALQYTPGGGHFSVRIQPVSDQINVIFTNDGQEISTEDLPFIFERFYRGEKSRSRDLGGAGIGLAIVRELVVAHGGNIGADVSKQQITIWFSLPRSIQRIETG
jgi:signal transduction histidine kinase